VNSPGLPDTIPELRQLLYAYHSPAPSAKASRLRRGKAEFTFLCRQKQK
jgi:hypothetical protein